MYKRKIKSVLSVLMILVLLQGCSIFGGSKRTTLEGVELSKSLTNTIDFLENFKLAYIAIGNIVTTAYRDGLITTNQYNNIIEYAENIRIEYNKNRYAILSWYDLESKDIYADKQEDANVMILVLLNQFKELTKIVENEMDLSLKDKQTMQSLLHILTLLSGGKQ